MLNYHSNLGTKEYFFGNNRIQNLKKNHKVFCYLNKKSYKPYTGKAIFFIDCILINLSTNNDMPFKKLDLYKIKNKSVP